MDAERIASVRRRLEQIEASPALMKTIMHAIAHGKLPLVIIGCGDSMQSFDVDMPCPFSLRMPGERT